ncbi:MAG TPA: type II secretion system protein [Candidatus Atribacteria bacterium]|nr:type II secretion system protein [Candidatus Atribacteria bacterium]
MFKKKNKKGFTLIELLVVIAIIGILTAGTFYFLNDARIRARDARRVADLREIANALEIYYSIYGKYPGGTSWSTWDNWMELLKDEGLMPVPIVDPINNATSRWSGCGGKLIYFYNSPTNQEGQKYFLAAVLESQGQNGCSNPCPTLGGNFATQNRFQLCMINGIWQ